MSLKQPNNYLKPRYMSPEQVRGMMMKLSEKHGIKLHYLNGNEGDGDNANRSFCAGCIGSGDIYLGVYEDIELEVISFFHELVHVIFDFDRSVISTMQYELYVTFKALEYAEKECKVLFSDDAIKWMLEQCLTYHRWDEREVRGYKF